MWKLCTLHVPASPHTFTCTCTHTHTHTHTHLLALLFLIISDVFLAFPDLSLGDKIESQSNTDKNPKGTHFTSSSIIEVTLCMTATTEEAPVVSASRQSVCENIPSRQGTLVQESTLETELF